MKKITIEIELRANDIDRKKFHKLINEAGKLLVGGATAFFEGNYDKESMDEVDEIIKQGKWYIGVKEEDIHIN